MREEEKEGRKREVTSFSLPSRILRLSLIRRLESRDAIFSQDDNGERNARR